MVTCIMLQTKAPSGHKQALAFTKKFPPIYIDQVMIIISQKAIRWKSCQEFLRKVKKLRESQQNREVWI